MSTLSGPRRPHLTRMPSTPALVGGALAALVTVAVVGMLASAVLGLAWKLAPVFLLVGGAALIADDRRVLGGVTVGAGVLWFVGGWPALLLAAVGGAVWLGSRRGD